MMNLYALDPNDDIEYDHNNESSWYTTDGFRIVYSKIRTYRRCVKNLEIFYTNDNILELQTLDYEISGLHRLEHLLTDKELVSDIKPILNKIKLYSSRHVKVNMLGGNYKPGRRTIGFK